MPYFAALLAQTPDGWTSREVDLESFEDLDSVVEEIRDFADGATGLLFLEENDEYLAIVRVDGDGDPRTFISDDRAIATSALAAMLMEDVAAPDEPGEDDDEAVRPHADAAGDADIVSSFGISSRHLLDLCAEEGMLPGDIITAICEKAGCAEILDDIRVG